jgi:hypothetical protein
MPSYEFNPITRELDITGTSGSSISTPVSVANGGTGSTTKSTAISNLSDSSSATDTQVLMAISGTASFRFPRIPEYTSDPSSSSGDIWMLRTDTGGTAGIPLGMLLAITQTVGATSSYQLSYKTSEGTIVRETLT